MNIAVVAVLALIGGVACQQKVYTDNGEACVFPFKYREVMYTECIKSSLFTSWCSTTSDYDADQQWGNCQKPLKPQEPGTGGATPVVQIDETVDDGVVRTVMGDACHFPFQYRSQMYTECIKSSPIASWCATTPNYDSDKRWGVCEKVKKNVMFSADQQIGHSGMTYGGNANLKRCVFPFHYNGEMKTECVRSSPTKSWCSVTADYNKDKKWGFCVKETCDLDQVLEDDCREKERTDSCGRLHRISLKQCRSCGYCGQCHDESTRCADIAAAGKCDLDKEFTSVNCHKSCGHC